MFVRVRGQWELPLPALRGMLGSPGLSFCVGYRVLLVVRFG